VKVIEDGKCLVHGETFTKLIQSIVTQEKNIIISVEETLLTVSYGKNKHTIKLSPFEDFSTYSKYFRKYNIYHSSC
jgi:hypothetical protein